MSKIKDYILLLKSSPKGASKIFWLNVCAHLEEQAIDIEVAKEVFNLASENFFASYPDPSKLFDAGDMAYKALIDISCKHPKILRSICRAAAMPSTADAIFHTVFRSVDFFDRYLKGKSSALSSVLGAVGLDLAIDGMSQSEAISKWLESLVDAGGNNLLLALDELDLMLDTAYFRGPATRFWSSIDNGVRPSDPQALAFALGLQYFKKDDWVIEVSYSLEILALLLGSMQDDLKRPSAICVVDPDTPRFRGLSEHEVGCCLRKQELDWHGTAVDLNNWHLAESDLLNGLPELLVTQVPWSPASPPSAVTIKGKIQVPHDVKVPTNSEYANYLERKFAAALLNENTHIESLLA